MTSTLIFKLPTNFYQLINENVLTSHKNGDQMIRSKYDTIKYFEILILKNGFYLYFIYKSALYLGHLLVDVV